METSVKDPCMGNHERYTPDTIRTVIAQEAHDYYPVHGFPLGYGSVPVRPLL